MINKNELIGFNSFEGNNVEIIMDENGNPLFEIYSTGFALGQTKEARGKLYPRKDRINQNIINAEISPVIYNGLKYINIQDLRKLISFSNTRNKIKFVEWLKNNKLIKCEEIFINTKKEIEFFNKLEEVLQPFNYSLLREIKDDDYRYDGLIKELNLIIEFDENNHLDYDSYKEFKRNQYIKSKNYNLIRIDGRNSPMYNIGLVMKKIIDLSLQNEYIFINTLDKSIII